MSAKSYSFKVGSIDCTVLLDGASVMGIERFLKRFQDASEADYRQAYADIGLSLDEADSSLNILVAKIGEATVLVDTGEAGRPNGGHLPESMRLAGITPDAITLVVLTHADGDHVKGLLSDDDEAAFPNATYVISKTEMAYWQGRIDDGVVDQAPMITMMKAKGLRLIDMDEQIMPGLTAVPIPGHKPGQIAVLFESENEKLIHMADLLHSPMQFAHPEWSASFDVDASISIPTRRAALGRAADENMLALFYHLTFPGLGRVKRAETGFTWEPVEISS
jgi:glyoxylase-like metal-dependent hydrolase (beta-lactamase superfamily II)